MNTKTQDGARKIKTITLSYLSFYVPFGVDDRGRNPPGWRVETVTDSTLHNPGDVIRKTDVDQLNASDEWKVTIRRPS